MAATGYETRTQVPLPQIRVPGTVVGEAFPLDTQSDGADRVALGVAYTTITCGPIQVGPSDCAASAYYSASATPLTETIQPAFSLWAAVECSSLSRQQMLLNDLLRWRLDALGSAAVGLELITGAASGGIGLTDGTALAASTGIIAAISTIEVGLAARMGNGRGFIHIPLGLLAYAKAAGAVTVDGEGNIRTAAGHTVVADGGYPAGTVYGSGPFGLSKSTFDLLTGPFGQMQPIGTNHNIIRHIADEYAVLAFDPCLVVKTAVS